MPILPGEINGLWIIEPRVFSDNRGFFYESYNHRNFVETTGFQGDFIQDNHSFSHYGVIRGLHFQKAPHAQSKLVRVVQGEVLDIAVDIRENSPSFGQYQSVRLSAENNRQFFVPQGFAHGFVVLSKTAVLLYKCDNYYAPQSESGIIYNDPELNIDWQVPEDKIIVSDKDKLLPQLSELRRQYA